MTARFLATYMLRSLRNLVFTRGRHMAAASTRGRLMAAAAAGSATTATITCCDSTSVPPFILGGERYDQNTFQGRLTKIQELIDIRTVFTSDEDLAAAQARLAEFKKLNRLPDGVTDLDMWKAQQTVDSIIHGPTGEKMFLAGRMSMFVPMNVPATAGMVMARTVPQVWQRSVHRLGSELAMVPPRAPYIYTESSVHTARATDPLLPVDESDIQRGKQLRVPSGPGGCIRTPRAVVRPRRHGILLDRRGRGEGSQGVPQAAGIRDLRAIYRGDLGRNMQRWLHAER